MARKICIFLVIFIGFGAVSICAADSAESSDFSPPDTLINLVQWQSADGGNDHWYAIMATAMPWEDAVAYAPSIEHNGMSGYLATVLSAEENDFIFTQIIADNDPPTYADQFYIGGGSDGWAWEWLTAETFGFSNWDPGEPNNQPVEIGLAMWYASGLWNNVHPDTTYGPIHQQWSIIEWGEPFPPDTIINLTFWPWESGGNNHWYAILSLKKPYEDAITFAPSLEHDDKNGYLATILSAEENDFIFSQLVADNFPPTYAAQFYLGGNYKYGSWTWLTGESFGFSNWNSGEPNNLSVEIGMAMLYSSGLWNNVHPDTTYGPLHQQWSIIEWVNWACGDVNGDGSSNIFDITHIIAYLYLDGPPPVDSWPTDVNGDREINIFDATYLIAALYTNGPEAECQ